MRYYVRLGEPAGQSAVPAASLAASQQPASLAASLGIDAHILVVLFTNEMNSTKIDLRIFTFSLEPNGRFTMEMKGVIY